MMFWCGNLGGVSGHSRETWARCQGFFGSMHNVSLSLYIYDDGTVFVGYSVFIYFAVYLSYTFFVGFLFSDFGLVLPLGYLGCRGYLKVLQSVLQMLLLFAKSVL